MVRSIVFVIMGGVFLLNGMAYAGSETFVNGGEIFSKENSGEATATMPDPCVTTPSPPAPSVPVPYPNIPSAADTRGESKKVKTGGKQIMLKGKELEKSAGDEGGTTNEISPQSTQTERYWHVGPEILKK